MLIRPALPSEAPLIKQLIHELALFEKAPGSAEATLEDLTQAFFGDNPAVFATMIEDDSGEVQGLAIWFLNYSTWTGTHGIYLEDLFIRPAARSQGLGRSLLQHLAEICVERGYHRLQWWVLDWNESAIEFYKSLGAAYMNDWTVMRLDGEALRSLAKPPTN
jgi:GNAT superfamily N-acetyltransferase